MFEHDGPLFHTKNSQVLTGTLKWAAHAFFKLFRLKLEVDNSLGCTGRYVCFESGSDASLWTMISFGAASFFFRAPDIPSAALTLLLLILAWRRSHVSCFRLIIVVSQIDCARTAWNVKLRQCNTTCWRKKHLSAGLQRQVPHVLRVLGPIRCPETLRAKRTLGQLNKT